MVIQTERLSEFVFPGNAMTNTLLAMSYISVLPNTLLYFVPKNMRPATLSLLFNFAGGSLLGDLSFHLLPHVVVAQKEDHTDYQNVVMAVGICLGGCLFYGIDRYIIYSGEPSHDQSKQIDQVPKKRYNLRPRKDDGKDTEVVTMKSEHTVHAGQKSPGAYLNVLADFIRNLINGIALAASFYMSPTAGLVTTITVFSHKISVEISDFIKAGYTKTDALRTQLVKMIGTGIGTFVGIALYEVARTLENSRAEDSRGLFGTTAGLDDAIISVIIGKFMYMVTVGIMVEMPSAKSKDRFQSIKEILSMAFGLQLIMFISWNELRQKYE